MKSENISSCFLLGDQFRGHQDHPKALVLRLCPSHSHPGWCASSHANLQRCSWQNRVINHILCGRHCWCFLNFLLLITGVLLVSGIAWYLMDSVHLRHNFSTMAPRGASDIPWVRAKERGQVLCLGARWARTIL